MLGSILCPCPHHGSPKCLIVAGESWSSPVLAMLRNVIFLKFSVGATALLAPRSWK